MATLKVSRGLHIVTALEIADSVAVTGFQTALLFDAITDASVPTPAATLRALYHSSDEGAMAVKTDAGTVINLETGAGGVSFPVTPTIRDFGTTSGTLNLKLDGSDAGDGHVHKMTANGNITVTFDNPPALGIQQEFEIEFKQDATGSRTLTLPTTVNQTVTVDSTALATTILTFRTNDGGLTYDAITTVAGTITGGGSQTPILQNVDFDNFDIFDIEEIRFANTGAITSTTTSTITSDSSGDMLFNVNAADSYFFYFLGGQPKFEVDTENVILRTLSGLTTNDLEFRNSDTTPADDDVMGVLKWTGYSSTGVTIFSYARIEGRQVDVTDTTKDGELSFYTLDGNSEKEWIRLNFGGGIRFNAPEIVPAGSGMDLGTTASEWDNLFVNTINPAGGGANDVTIAGGLVIQSTASDPDTNNEFRVNLGGVLLRTEEFKVFRTNNAALFTIARVDATPLDNQILGEIQFLGDNDNSPQDTDIYGRIRVTMTDVSSTTEEAKVEFYAMEAGTITEFFQIQGGSNIDFLKGLQMNNNDVTGFRDLKGNGDLNSDIGDTGNHIQNLFVQSILWTTSPVVGILLSATGLTFNIDTTGDTYQWNVGAAAHAILDTDTLTLGTSGGLNLALIPNAATHGYVELGELSGDPANAPTNKCRIYCKANGTKTDLYVIFQTGAGVLIAPEV